MAHLREHAPAVDVETLDLTPLRDPVTGRVDLDKLAAALSGHDEGQPHSHGPGDTTGHGDGSLEHLSLALATCLPVLAAPLLTPQVSASVRLAQAPATRVPGLVFLSAQRSQAPPV